MILNFSRILLAAGSLLLTQAAHAQLYDVRTGTVSYNKNSRPAVKVQVDGSATDVRDYFQEWMKTNYNVRFKSGGLKNPVLLAKQTPASTISGKLVDLYATVVAPTDSTTELAVFGGFDDNTFFDADKTAAEFNALRAMTMNFATAARTKAYREKIEEAERKLRDAEKEKERLEKERQALASNTAANLLKIQTLQKQNTDNTLLSRADSTQLTRNAEQQQIDRIRLQRRRDRLSALDRK